MTESEAIERIEKCVCASKQNQNLCNDDCKYSADKCVFSLAIQALKGVQARDKKVWHNSDEIPDTEDCYIVAWLPQEGQCKADSPHYYAIWSYEDGEWQIYVPNDFADKEIILLAWTELPEPYHKEREENKAIDTDKIVKQIENIEVSKDSNGIVNGCNQGICRSDDCIKCLKEKVIEIIKAGGKE